ncbi:Na(+)/H(+) exchange regulatory cofactor NHE-RF1 [Lucilia cuprina]|uniref:Na(+)/H(+) exchange regulatory cofactor NHE-RF1 n=1 Tax=Lucilia cuprina TaxID=7375 RepID=UPI001F05A19E|nr:Na(+)/H(+) exchange regulatory cofactor NHE-RF1 [Lucilia cuprina]
MSQTEMKASSPTPSSATTPDVINKAATKLCHIVKRPDFDGYGFNLHSEKAKPGQFIGKVDANSPAEAAGLKEGDRIIEVNGVAINSETHKQVVQRIKAIAGEVRLLLVDVEGKGDGLMFNGQQSNGKTAMETSKTEQVLPGASENINSITMVSTKRASQESQRSSAQVNNNNSMDVTDKAVSVADQTVMMNNNNNNIPPPPSATMATSPTKSMMNNNISSNNTLSNSNSAHTEMPAASAASGSASGNGTTIKAGSLQLPMTAAEMRAKLMMKKKYDPKNESVDLKKKYEIVQKL